MSPFCQSDRLMTLGGAGGRGYVWQFLDLDAPILTKTLIDNMEERKNWSINKAIQLINKSLFDHLVSCNVHHPLTASLHTEHRTVCLSQLQAGKIRRRNVSQTFIFFKVIPSICRQ